MSPCFVIRGVLNPFIRYSDKVTCEHLGSSLVLVGCLLTRASTNRDNTSFLLLFSQTWRRTVHHYIWKKTKLFAQWPVLSIKTSYISLPSVPLNCMYLHRSYYVFFKSSEQLHSKIRKLLASHFCIYIYLYVHAWGC